MRVEIRNSQRALPLSKASARTCVLALLEFLGLSCDQISIHFVGKKEISNLHEIYFDDPSVTDTISFPIDLPNQPAIGERHLGEVFICPAVAQEYAKKNNLDPYLELTLYLVHGILHLAGFDDLKPNKKKKMRAQEARCMRALRKLQAVLQVS